MRPVRVAADYLVQMMDNVIIVVLVALIAYAAFVVVLEFVHML
jgi:hypothetical protein